MKEQRDTPRPTMSDEEMIKDYPRLAREYTLLHQDYREAIRKPLNIPIVSQHRELLSWMKKNHHLAKTEEQINELLLDYNFEQLNCG